MMKFPLRYVQFSTQQHLLNNIPLRTYNAIPPAYVFLSHRKILKFSNLKTQSRTSGANHISDTHTTFTSLHVHTQFLLTRYMCVNYFALFFCFTQEYTAFHLFSLCLSLRRSTIRLRAIGLLGIKTTNTQQSKNELVLLLIREQYEF